MKRQKTLSITVEQFDSDWPPTDATGALAWFRAKLDDIPAEFRGGASSRPPHKRNAAAPMNC